MKKIDLEVKDCFRDNPKLASMTIQQIAEFFVLQGELRYSLLKQVLENKASYYAMRLRDADKEQYDKAKEFWDEASKTPSAESKIGML